MSTFSKHPHIWRSIGLLLLLLALFAPWTYEGVYMPPDSPCAWPNSQPAGHPYCGLALPVLLEVAGLIPLAAALLGGDASLSQWAAYSALPLLLTLSILALALLLLVRQHARSLLYAPAWALAAVAGSGFLIRGYYKPYALPWGNLLFIAVALAALALECFVPAGRTPSTLSPGHSTYPGESPRLNP